MDLTKPFWVVWNPRRGSPTAQHPSSASAESEARRLAQLNPGEDFLVLQSVANFHKVDVDVTDLTPDNIPF